MPSTLKYLILLILFIFNNQLSYSQTKSDTLYIDSLNMKSYSMVYSKPPEARRIAFQSIAESKRVNYQKGLSSAYVKLGIYYDVVEHYDSAISSYEASMSICKKIGYLKGEGAAYCNLGLVYLNLNDYPNALKNLYAAVKPLEAANERGSLANCYNNIGLLYTEIDNFSKAYEYYQLALKEYKTAKNNTQIASTISNIAMLYTEEQKYDSSIFFELQSIEVFSKNNDYYNLSKSYNNVGMDYWMLKQYNKAIESYLLSIKYSKLIGSNRGLADTYGNIANAYSHLNQMNEANRYIDLSNEHIPFVKSKKEVADLYSLFARIKRKQGNHKLASEFFFKSMQLKDSVFKSESAELIAKAEIKFGIESKELKNRQLEQKNRIQELELQNSQNEITYRKKFNYLIITLSLLLIVILIWYFNKRYQYFRFKEFSKNKEQQQNQRIHISNELHDNVGAQLAYIVNNLEMMDNTSQEQTRINAIKEMSKQAIVTLRETVWALNNKSISIDAFSDKFKEYSNKILEMNSNIEYEFKENFESSYTLEPIQALNLFRMCQEAFSNAINHSKASKIYIEFSNNKNTLIDVKIKDNGIGFDKEFALKKGHYGLISMQTRSEEIGATFNINSKLDEGSQVHFKIEKISA